MHAIWVRTEAPCVLSCRRSEHVPAQTTNHKMLASLSLPGFGSHRPAYTCSILNVSISGYNFTHGLLLITDSAIARCITDYVTRWGAVFPLHKATHLSLFHLWGRGLFPCKNIHSPLLNPPSCFSCTGWVWTAESQRGEAHRKPQKEELESPLKEKNS